MLNYTHQTILSTQSVPLRTYILDFCLLYFCIFENLLIHSSIAHTLLNMAWIFICSMKILLMEMSSLLIIHILSCCTVSALLLEHLWTFSIIGFSFVRCLTFSNLFSHSNGVHLFCLGVVFLDVVFSCTID